MPARGLRAELLGPNSAYGDAFAGGVLAHSFLFGGSDFWKVFLLMVYQRQAGLVLTAPNDPKYPKDQDAQRRDPPAECRLRAST